MDVEEGDRIVSVAMIEPDEAEVASDAAPPADAPSAPQDLPAPEGPAAPESPPPAAT
jgi:hypothetical protein